MDLGQVTLTQLRYAVAVADALSFHRAAEQCHVSQSGLSMQIQKLEELLELRLFDRSRKPVMVTAEGAAALDQMRAMLRELQRLGQIAAEGLEPSGPYRLGVIPSMAASVLPLFLGDFVRECPKVNLIVEELKTDDLIKRLRADTVDAGIAATPLGVDGFEERVLGVEALYAYVAPGDPLLERRKLSQADLSRRELWVMPEGHCFRSQVLSYCKSDAEILPAPVRFESGSFETLIRLVDGGLGATILPELVTRNLTDQRRLAQSRPLTSPVPAREIGLVTARTSLRRRVKDRLQEIASGRLAEALRKSPRNTVILDPLPKS